MLYSVLGFVGTFVIGIIVSLLTGKTSNMFRMHILVDLNKTMYIYNMIQYNAIYGIILCNIIQYTLNTKAVKNEIVLISIGDRSQSFFR